jgi:hypothetical protein
MAKHYLMRQGTRGTASVLGLYGYTGTGTPALLGDTYDKPRSGKSGNYVPALYSKNSRRQICPAGDTIPLFSVSAGSSGRYQFYFDSGRDTPGVTHGNETRYHYTSDGVAGPVAVAINAGIQAKHLVALHTTDTTYFAIAAEATPRVWTSSNGTIWTQGSALTGMSGLEQGQWCKCFAFGAAVFLFQPFGIYRNAAADLVGWAAVPLLGPAYDAMCYHDVAWDGTAIVVACQGRDSGVWYNVILRSTDGTTFTEVRRVQQTLDAPGGGLNFDLEWRNIAAFSTGFCIYGCNPFSGAFPYVLKSTDHGATWTLIAISSAVYALLSVSGYAGATAVIASVPYDTGSDPPVYSRLMQATDGVTFTTLGF